MATRRAVARSALVAVLLMGYGSAFSAAVSTSGERARSALEVAYPGTNAIYIDIPATGSPVANWMLGAVAGQATSLDQLKAAMALGAETPTNLVVGGENESVTRKAVQSAIESFRGRQLPHLTLAVVGTSLRAEKLREQAESLGITYIVLPSPFEDESVE